MNCCGGCATPTASIGTGLRGFLFHRGQKGGAAAGPNPTDRGRPGTKRHLATNAKGITLGFLLMGANVHDSVPFEELIVAIPAVAEKRGRLRRRPATLHADKAYEETTAKTRAPT